MRQSTSIPQQIDHKIRIEGSRRSNVLKPGCTKSAGEPILDAHFHTEHLIHRDWCSRCKRKVEAPVTDALPGSTIGNRVLALGAWQHYALGNTLDQIVDVFNFHMQLKITPGGLAQIWYRLQEMLFPWYEQLHQEAMKSARLHADETGWRVAGQTHWLWCFGND
jgi:hypothetical protein